MTLDSIKITDGVVNLNGFTLTVNGDVNQIGGTIDINIGNLIVGGDYILKGDKTWSYSYLKMVNAEDYVLVEGDFIQHSIQDHEGYLTAGTLEVKGDFRQEYSGYVGHEKNFYASGEHKVLLSGDEAQTVSFEKGNSNQSRFNILEIKNSSTDGVNFETKVAVVKELISMDKTMGPVVNGKNLNLVGTAKIVGGSWLYDLGISEDWTLQKDEIIEGSVTIIDGVVDLNGNRLRIGKDLVQNAPTIQKSSMVYINSGVLEVGGDYILKGDKTWSYSYLKMVNAEDYVIVEGDFIQHSRQDHEGYLTAGTLEVKGDFRQEYSGYVGHEKNFNASGEHKVILSGNKLQRISFDKPGYSNFNHLIITKPFEYGYVFNTTDKIWNTIEEDFTYSTPRAGTTNRIAALSTAKGNLSAAVVNTKVYALGGYNGNYILNSAQN